jgi:predicted unusual protein kinase regulating ubiquinone biosynthesis (AarF/ABC1/UbiB family)
MAAEHEALLNAARSAFELVANTTSTRLALAHLASLIGEERIPRAVRPPEPMAFKEVERLLKSAWGRPHGKVLDALEREPAAVTAASQVHRGEAGGRAVAVKLRRPGLAEVVRSDLVLAEAAAGAFAGVLPELDIAALVGEVRERLMDELDLEYEAATQRRFARALRDHPRLHVPAPDMELSEEGVLVSDWVDGTPIRALRSAGDRRAAAEAIVEFVVSVPGLVGVAVADPHPDDALLMADGRLAVVDFGAVREVPRARVALAADALDAFIAADAAALAKVLEALGWLPAATTKDAQLGLDIAEDLLGPVLRGEAPFTAEALEDAAYGLERHAGTIARQARRSAVLPEDVWPLRGIGQLGIVLAHLGVQADWLELARAALRP